MALVGVTESLGTSRKGEPAMTGTVVFIVCVVFLLMCVFTDKRY